MERSRSLARLLLGVSLAALLVCAAAPAHAGPYDCNKCDGGGVFLPDVCHWVDEGESGHTICTDTSGCHVSGDSCTGNYGGGGGDGPGGGGGGGDDDCGSGSWCPAECFSCGGDPAY